LKAYSHEDPDLKPILPKISKVTKQAEALKLPYWVFVKDSKPVGIVVAGKEPIQLLAPLETPMAIIDLLNMRMPKESIGAFAAEALKLAAKKNVGYALAQLPFEEDTAINQFRILNFKEFDDCYHMVCKLDKIVKSSGELRITRVKKENIHRFMTLTKRFMKGSPDIALKKALDHILELPDQFLDSYYRLEEFYIAYKNGQAIGILNLNTTKGLISNVGVDPQERGQGYGRQIMLFGLEKLKKSGREQAYLRVHVKNKPAVHLYESLGFEKAKRYKRLIWQKKEKTE
jgi:GNAT superfamily N-acetyltransferase